MPKVTFNLGADAANVSAADGGGAFYDGPTPPAGPYVTSLKRLELTKTKLKDGGGGGDPMFKMVCEINEPQFRSGKKNSKAEFNGYGIWVNQLMTQANLPYARAFFDALTGGDAEVWKSLITSGCTTDDDGMVTKIGKMRFDPQSGKPIMLMSKRGVYKGDSRLEQTRWLQVVGTDDAAAPEDDSDEEVDADILAALESQDSSADDDGDESEDGGDESVGDEEPEDEPVATKTPLVAVPDEEDDEEEEEAEVATVDPAAIRREELEDMSRRDLIALAKGYGLPAKKSFTEADYREAILTHESAPKAAAADDDDEPPF